MHELSGIRKAERRKKLGGFALPYIISIAITASHRNSWGLVAKSKWASKKQIRALLGFSGGDLRQDRNTVSSQILLSAREPSQQRTTKLKTNIGCWVCCWRRYSDKLCRPLVGGRRKVLPPKFAICVRSLAGCFETTRFNPQSMGQCFLIPPQSNMSQGLS